MAKMLFNKELFNHELSEANIAVGKCMDSIAMLGKEVVRSGQGVRQTKDQNIIPLYNTALKIEGIEAIAFPKNDNGSFKFRVLMGGSDVVYMQPYQLSVHVLRNIHQELWAIYDKID
jgi:hypothetical protein